MALFWHLSSVILKLIYYVLSLYSVDGCRRKPEEKTVWMLLILRKGETKTLLPGC